MRMKSVIQGRGTCLLISVYRRLVRLYPENHRHKYGDLMVTRFRDLCRDASKRGSLGEFLSLLVRTGTDLIKTLLSEHLHALNQRLSTMKLPPLLFRPATLAILAFVLVVTSSGIVTALSPRLYRSFAVLSLAGSQGQTVDQARIQIELERMLSDSVLNEVTQSMVLATHQPDDHSAGLNRPVLELRRRIEVRQFGNAALIAVGVRDRDKHRSADVANSIAQVYARSAAASSKAIRVTLVDVAEPALAPILPNPARNLALGIAAGGLAALVAGSFVSLWRRQRPAAAT